MVRQSEWSASQKVGQSERQIVGKSERQIVGKSDWLKSRNGLTVGKSDSWKVRLVEKLE